MQKQLGHSSLTTTQIYADITPEQSIAGMDAMERMVRSLGRRSPGKQAAV